VSTISLPPYAMAGKTLALTGLQSAEIAIAPEARELSDKLLVEIRDITAVSDAFDADVAVDVMKRATQLSRGIEADRNTVKAPVLALGKKIDALAKEIVVELDAEISRVSRVLGAYQLAEKQKAEAAERLARDEVRRIQAEAEQAARAAAKAASNDTAALAAASEIMDQAAAKIVETRKAIVSTAAPKAANTAVRKDVCFEVTDIVALYAARPELVNLEPNGTAIRAICKANPTLQLPGLRHWTEAKTNIR